MRCQTRYHKVRTQEIVKTINEALRSKYLSRVIVSTEDKEISEIAQEYAAEVIERPLELASPKGNTRKGARLTK